MNKIQFFFCNVNTKNKLHLVIIMKYIKTISLSHDRIPQGTKKAKTLSQILENFSLKQFIR